MNKLKENLKSIAGALSAGFMKSIGAGNVSLRSERTIKFDISQPNPAGINQIKVTKDGDGFMVKFYRVEEIDMIYGVPAGNVQSGIAAVLNGPAPFEFKDKVGE